MTAEPDSLSTGLWRTLERFVHILAAAVVSGMVAGAVAGGVGSRIAMRITALTASDAQQGAITEAEATVGEITGGGTFFLIFFGGIAFGSFGGLLYAGMRRWVSDAGPWRGLVFGGLLLAMFGWAIVEGDNPDFAAFGSPTLNIVMFASLYVAFGLIIAPLFDRVEGWLPESVIERERAPSSGDGWQHPAVIVAALLIVTPLGVWLLARRGGLRSGWKTVLALGAYGLAVLLAVLMIPIVVGGGGEGGDNRVFFSVIPAYGLLVMPVAGMLLANANGGFERLSDLRGRPASLAAAVAVLALPVVVGLALDVDAVAQIYDAA
ncbi:MAG: hypothetical protein WD379_03390 [Dehalococcoidia bacterium]